MVHIHVFAPVRLPGSAYALTAGELFHIDLHTWARCEHRSGCCSLCFLLLCSAPTLSISIGAMQFCLWVIHACGVSWFTQTTTNYGLLAGTMDSILHGRLCPSSWALMQSKCKNRDSWAPSPGQAVQDSAHRSRFSAARRVILPVSRHDNLTIYVQSGRGTNTH